MRHVRTEAIEAAHRDLFAVLDLWEVFPTDTVELWVMLAVSKLDRLKAELDAERQRLH